MALDDEEPTSLDGIDLGEVDAHARPAPHVHPTQALPTPRRGTAAPTAGARCRDQRARDDIAALKTEVAVIKRHLGIDGRGEPTARHSTTRTAQVLEAITSISKDGNATHIGVLKAVTPWVLGIIALVSSAFVLFQRVFAP